jgi:hypothetical protein
MYLITIEYFAYWNSLGVRTELKKSYEEKGVQQIWLVGKLGKSFNEVNGCAQNR